MVAYHYSGTWPEFPRVANKPEAFIEFATGSNLLVVDSAGFPMLCIEKQVNLRHDKGLSSGVTSFVSERGLLRFSRGGWDGLPASPLWGGLAVNTAVYGAAWYPLLALPGLVLARLRRRKGKCGACGYDMRGLAASTCPECGKG